MIILQHIRIMLSPETNIMVYINYTSIEQLSTNNCKVRILEVSSTWALISLRMTLTGLSKEEAKKFKEYRGVNKESVDDGNEEEKW